MWPHLVLVLYTVATATRLETRETCWASAWIILNHQHSTTNCDQTWWNLRHVSLRPSKISLERTMVQVHLSCLKPFGPDLGNSDILEILRTQKGWSCVDSQWKSKGRWLECLFSSPVFGAYTIVQNRTWAAWAAAWKIRELLWNIKWNYAVRWVRCRRGALWGLSSSSHVRYASAGTTWWRVSSLIWRGRWVWFSCDLTAWDWKDLWVYLRIIYDKVW